MGPGPYKGTVNLPQTKFNMRANSTQKEPEIQRRWQEDRVYEQLVENNPGPIYTLHDGPPYANGFVTPPLLGGSKAEFFKKS